VPWHTRFRFFPIYPVAILDYLVALTAQLDDPYNAAMTIGQVRRMHQARPFQAFEIVLADGRSLPVEHPEVLAIPPPGRTIIVALADGTFEVVDLLLVTSLKARSNGAPRGRRHRA
jgi:hypothetical protein